MEKYKLLIMQLEALQLLKDQLCDHFIDKYEDFQALFLQASGLGGTELAKKPSPQRLGSPGSTFGQRLMIDDEYILYPEMRVNANTTTSLAGSTPMKGEYPKSTFSSAIGTVNNVRGSSAQVNIPGNPGARPGTSPVIQLIKDQKEEQSQAMAQIKRLSNNQEYQMLVKYQAHVNQVIDEIFKGFLAQVRDPQFLKANKDLLILARSALGLSDTSGTGVVQQDSNQAQAVEIQRLKKQLQDYKAKLQKNEELINNLRKQYLKELVMLKEAHNQGSEKVKDTLAVSFFDVTDGIDTSIVEILNLRLADMQKQFTEQMNEKSKTINYLNETIVKYKRLAPKAFKMMDMTLMDIFYSIAVVEQDAAKVWTALLRSFPSGHFDGIIEDMYGGKMTSDQEKRIQRELEETMNQCTVDVRRQTDRLSAMHREKDFQLKQKVEEIAALKDLHQHNLKILSEDLRMQFEMKLRDLEKFVNNHYTKELGIMREKEIAHRKERDKLKKEITLLQKQKFFLRMQSIGRLLVQYRKEEEEGTYPHEVRESKDNRPFGMPELSEKLAAKFREKKNFRLEREDVANQFYERVRQLVLGSDISRLQAKLDLRKEMMKDYKDKYEKATKELYELKLQINEQIDDYDNIKLRITEMQTAMNQLESYNHQLKLQMQKIANENEALRDANKATLALVQVVERSKWLLEEKYNASLEQIGDDFILRKKFKSKETESRTLQDKIMERLQNELHGAYNAVTMVIYSHQLFESKAQNNKIDSDTQTNLKNIHLKITQEQPNYSSRKKHTIETGIDEYCQTKIKAEQFDFYIKQQLIEKERLEKRLNKMRERDADEIDIAQLIMQDNLTKEGANAPQNGNGQATANQEQKPANGMQTTTQPNGQPAQPQVLTPEQAIEEQEKLKQAEKQIMEGVQKELKEKNDALSGLLGPGVARKSRGPRKRRGPNGEWEEDDESEDSEDQQAKEERLRQELLARKSLQSRGSKKSTMRAGFESSRILNIKNGKLKKYKDSWMGGEGHGSDNGDITHRFHPDMLKDPRYFQKSMEFAISEDGALTFPKLEDFAFDKDKYLRALSFLKGAMNNDPRRKISRDQATRLYPTHQPEVFQRLIKDSANAVSKFDRKLKELQQATEKSWHDRLQSQNFISEEQLIVLGGAERVSEPLNTARVLKVMDKMLKIGKSETQSPRFAAIKDGGRDFFKVKGVNQSNIFTTGKQSKLKLPKTADRGFRTKNKKQGRNGVVSQVELPIGTPGGSRSVKRVGVQNEDLILLKDGETPGTAEDRKRRIIELISASGVKKGEGSQQRRQIQQLLLNTTTLTDTPGAVTAESLNKESVYTLDSSRIPANTRLPQRLGDQGIANPLKGCLTANVSLEETPENTKQSQKSSVRKPRNDQSLLQGFVDKELLSPHGTTISTGAFIKTADGLGASMVAYQNQDLTFSATPQGTDGESPSIHYLAEPYSKGHDSVIKNKQASLPSTPAGKKRNINNSGARANKQQSLQQRTMEIFSHEESLERRMQYTVPKNIHNLINDIAHKNQQQLHSNTMVIKQQEAVLMSKRRKAQPMGAK